MPFLSPLGLERLGSNKLASSATSVGAITIPPRDLLLIWIAVTGYGGSDIAALQFNGDSTVGNYGSRMEYVATAGSATLTNQSNAGTIARIPIGPTGVTTPRTAMASINNHTQSAVKPVTLMADVATAGGTTEINNSPVQIWGQYTAASAGTQITQVNLITPTSNMLTGTGFIVFGANM